MRTGKRANEFCYWADIGIKLPTLYIIGNGPGQIPDKDQYQPCVIFNPPKGYQPTGLEIGISNWKQYGGKDKQRHFVVESSFLDKPQIELLEQGLANFVQALQENLDCFPSTGLVAVHYGIHISKQVNVYRMPLKPSLERPLDMFQRKPLPCVFHNWLGERRIGFNLINLMDSDRLNWPSLYLDKPPSEYPIAQTDPFLELLALFKASPLEDNKSALIAGFQTLSRYEPMVWLNYAEVDKLMSLEPYFFLDRDSRYTSNWWLYDYAASKPLDKILHILMWCQQKLYLRKGGL